MQIGRSFLKCFVKKSFSLFGCCTISETKNFDYYYKQNIIEVKDSIKKTIKTEDDYEMNDIEEENKTMFNEYEEDNITNNKKSNEEDNLVTNVEVLNSPKKLKSISECVEENKNEGNNSIHIDE